MASPAAVLSILVTANTSQATRGLVRLNTQLGATESSASKALGAIKTMTKGAAIGAGIGLGYAVKKAADFEQQMDSLGAVTDATGKQMERLRRQAMKAGADTKFSALEAAQAQTELAKGGLQVAQIAKGGLRSALALAAAGEMELADAASTTANAMNLFGLRGKAAMRVADALAKAANATTADVSDFAMALQQGGSVAKSAGLSFTETVLALEALAASGIKNSDAGTSLKTSLIQLIKPTAKQRELADKLNVSFVDQQGHFKNLSDIADMLRERLGGMTKAQRTAALATLAGTDGVRTLTALYDAGSGKLDKWRQGLKEQGTAADVAAKKQDNLKGKLENLQGSVETAAIAIGSKMLPALTDAAEKITDLINNPNLTSQQKLDKFGDMLSKALANLGPKVAKAAGAVGLVAVRAFFNAFRDSPLWLKLITATFLINKFGGFQGFKKAGAAAGGAMAEGAATSFGGRMKGRMFAIGKGIAGAALIAGLTDAVTRQGISGFGDRFQQFASTASLGLLPPPKDIQERLGKIATQIRNWRSSGLLKLSDPNDPDNSLIRQKDLGDFTGRQRKMLAGMAELRNTASRFFGPGQHLIDKAWANPERAQKQLRSLVNEFGRMRSGAVLNVKDLRQVTQSNFKAIAETMGVNSKRGKAAVEQNFHAGLRIIKGFLKDGTLSTAQGMSEVQRLLRVHSKAGKESLQTNFKEARDFIAKTMRNSKGITKEGMSAIRQIFAQELRLYGLSSEAIKFRLQGKEQSGKTIGAPLVNKQRGGPITVGAAVGDSVPAMLERGEYVLNRNVVRKVGKRNLDRLNFAAAPRFQAGGMAGMVAAANKLDAAHFPYVWGGGHQGSPAPFGPMDCSGAVSFVLQHGGVKVPTMVSGALASAGSPGPGKVTVFANDHHTFMRIGGRYFGTSGSNPGGGAGWMPDPGAGYRGGFAQRHFKAFGGTLGIPRLKVRPDSALASVASGALAGVRSAARARLDALSSMTIGAGDIGDSGPGGNAANRKLGQRMAGGFGWGRGSQWSALDDLWGRLEGSWDENLFNLAGSGAYGIAQALPASKYPPAGQPSAPPGAAKAAAQIGWGLDYIKGRYGTPVNAHAFRLASGYYQKGGLAGLVNRATNIVGGLNKKGHRFPAKQRSKALHKLLDRVKGIDVPPALGKNLKKFQKDADIFGDMADRAGQLTVDDGSGNSIQGVVGGLTEGEWLTKQLEALFKLRNALIRAQKIIAAKRERVVKLVVQAQKRLKATAVQIRAAAKIKAGLEKQLKAAQKHPKRNAALIKDLKGKIHDIDRGQGVRTRERNVLKNRMLPALTGKRDQFGSSLRDDIGPAIETVQGLGSPMKVLRSLPDVGALGGSIFDVQMRLRALNEKPAVTDNTATGESADLLRQLLSEANLRTAVSQAQYDVFRNMPVFHQGGVMPGPYGREQMAVVRAGEGVFTPEQMAALGGGNVVVHVVVEDGAVDKSKIRAEVEKATRNMSRRVTPLPGRGGGIQR